MPEVAMSRAPLRRCKRPSSPQGRARVALGAHNCHDTPIVHVGVTVPSALDDCIALRHVMGFLAARLGLGLVDLHRQFAVRFDEPASLAQVHTLLDD